MTSLFETLVVIAVVLVTVDRLALWAESRGWIYWRRTPRPARTAVGAVMGDLLETFQPTRQHIVAESDRQRLDIQHPEDGAPPGGVDLESSRVVLARPSRQTSDAPPELP